MNWLDWVLLILLLLAGLKGFQRGFVVELASLVALVLGIWAGVHVSDRVAALLGIGPDQRALAFLVTFLLVLIGVHLLAHVLTRLIDLAQLGLPNKLAGVGFGMLRSAFALSVLLNLLTAYTEGALPPADTRADSRLAGPIGAFAPAVLPVLRETKWVRDALEQARQEVLGDETP